MQAFIDIFCELYSKKQTGVRPQHMLELFGEKETYINALLGNYGNIRLITFNAMNDTCLN